MANQLFRKKSIDAILRDANEIATAIFPMAYSIKRSHPIIHAKISPKAT
jgi:hypothetical protein